MRSPSWRNCSLRASLRSALPTRSPSRHHVRIFERFDEVVDLCEAFVRVQVRLLDETAHGSPQPVGEEVRVKATQKLK
jgi:hypothetical protein